MAAPLQREPIYEKEAARDSTDRRCTGIFVYKCNGGVDEYENAELVLRPRTMLIIQANRVIATYDRAKIFIATRSPLASPILF